MIRLSLKLQTGPDSKNANLKSDNQEIMINVGGDGSLSASMLIKSKGVDWLTDYLIAINTVFKRASLKAFPSDVKVIKAIGSKIHLKR